jgi:preprotein translocase subunit Sec61beta
MAEQSMPSGMGGLVRFKESYKTKFSLKPVHVIIFIVLILVFRIALNFIFKS